MQWLRVTSQGKISCKILDTLQEKGHFTCKILAPCKFLTRFLLLAKNCARNVKFLAQFLQERGHFQCTERARTCKICFPGLNYPQAWLSLLLLLHLAIQSITGISATLIMFHIKHFSSCCNWVHRDVWYQGFRYAAASIPVAYRPFIVPVWLLALLSNPLWHLIWKVWVRCRHPSHF